jgi:hypothetical protein
MINKSKTLVLGLSALAVFGLVSCGGTSSSSSSAEPDIVDPTQNTSEVVSADQNLQIVGAIDGVSDWDPTTKKNPHFTKESAKVYTLKNITIPAGSQYKFTFDDKWSNDFGTTGLDKTNSDAAYIAAIKGDGNIEQVTAMTVDFYFHPLFAYEGLTNKMIVKVHA